MRVVLPEDVVRDIRRHAEATYPEECCGFLVGPNGGSPTGSDRRILRTIVAENRTDGERRRRFEIQPEELRRVERLLDGTGEAVLGFYHSHPDHPAVPSQFDQDHAWPWYTYIVLAVTRGQAADFGAFELDAAERRFAPVPWTTDSGSPDRPVKDR